MKITVFTPTYNRAYIIENLYHSLQRQTFHDFEWLVIDDGSTDNTELLFHNIKAEDNFFPIRYYRCTNGGKCRAINKALDFARGELFFTVDSDDYLTDDALMKIAQWESELPDHSFCGVAGNLGISCDETTNTQFPVEYYDGTFMDRYSQVDGERAIAIYTDIHRCYKYPEFPKENFMTEAVAWNRIAHSGYKMRFYNDIICIYKYRSDGLTNAGIELFLNNPQGYGLWLKEKEIFLNNSSFFSNLKLCYSFTCELSNRYSNTVIAKCIGAPVIVIAWMRVLHSLKLRLGGKNSESE